jgi:DNA-binding HxlR family transcriptional regulator
MHVSDYLEIRDLFQTKWDPAVLAALSQRPARFLALVRRVRSSVDDEVPDGTVARSLDRLQQLGYVHADPHREGEREYLDYTLTVRGVQAVAAYRAIIAAYRRVRERPAAD